MIPKKKGDGEEKTKERGKRDRFCPKGKIEKGGRVGCQRQHHGGPSIVDGVDRVAEEREPGSKKKRCEKEQHGERDANGEKEVINDAQEWKFMEQEQCDREGRSSGRQN